ncbi:FMN-binding negative transcriptional regulator [Rhodococcus tibetensis]|uniref:FMN-binding negative transcriptional regulator n=1 Tax=Rhodococcus tibetensis TaxID=2965064 RepID=A0ABT1QJD0_9NOCA|nr:FMN-binding negative transcriptional regulator [Rhodococcus sp. FXJ9.536]MCQ4122364.1 FMN-binding negative transcriptional regulator [Rhodococcus sp. FXJ9.536]
MYIPEHYRQNDPQAIRTLIRAHPFATLIALVNERPAVVHIPFVLDEDGDRLLGHFALANPLTEAVRSGAEATAAFVGPQSYISPRHYLEPAAHFPTWNYSIVHVRGALRGLDRTETVRFLRTLIDTSEGPIPGPDAVDIRSGPLHLFEGFLARVIAFELPMAEVEGAFKLSQNKTSTDLDRQVEYLSGGTHTQQELAEHMAEVADVRRTEEAGQIR